MADLIQLENEADDREAQLISLVAEMMVDTTPRRKARALAALGSTRQRLGRARATDRLSGLSRALGCRGFFHLDARALARLETCARAFRDGRRDEFVGGIAETRSLCEAVAWRALVAEGMPPATSARRTFETSANVEHIVDVPWKRVLRQREQMQAILACMESDAERYSNADDPTQSALENDLLRARVVSTFHDATFRLFYMHGDVVTISAGATLTEQTFYETLCFQLMIWTDNATNVVAQGQFAWNRLELDRRIAGKEFGGMMDPKILADRVRWCDFITTLVPSPWPLTVLLAAMDMSWVSELEKVPAPDAAKEEPPGCVVA